MKKIVLFVSLFVLTVLAISHIALANDSIVVFIRTGPEATGMRAVAEEFTEQTGIKVEFMESGRSGYFSTMTTQLVSGTDTFDIVATNSAYVAQLAASEAIAPLDQFINQASDGYNVEDIIFTYGYEGKTYSIPFDVSTHFLYYRKDLIDTPPQTWDEYLEIAKHNTQAINPDSPTMLGTSLTALAGPELPKTFYSVMWSMGGEIIGDDGAVELDSPGAIAAAKYYRELKDTNVIPQDISSWGFPNVLDALQIGLVAMAGPYWNAAYPQILEGDSPYKDNIGITLLPGVQQDDGTILRTPFQHGWSFVMNENSKQKDLAWKFFEYATSAEGALIYALNGGTPARRSVLQNPELQPREYYELMLSSLEISRDEPALVQYLQVHEEINQALTAVLTSSRDPEAIMQNVSQRVQDVLQ